MNLHFIGNTGWLARAGRWFMLENETPISNEVPRVFPVLMRWSLLTTLIVASALSFGDLSTGTPLPMALLLDVWISGVLVYSVLRRTQDLLKSKLMPVAVIALLYGMTIILIAVARGAPWFELGQSYRWLFYAVAFLFISGEYWGSTARLIPLTWVILLFAGVKVAASSVFFPDQSRPVLLVESNFEMSFFIGLSALIYSGLLKGRPLLILVLGGLVLLESSRSGAFAFLLFSIYAAVSEHQGASNWKTLLARSSIPIFASAIAILVFFARDLRLPTWNLQGLTDPEAISPIVSSPSVVGIISRADRSRFLEIFLSETSNWDIWNWIFGTLPITPISAEGCSFFTWSSLAASTGDGSCYSVVFHAFILRIIFDAGFVGGVLAFGLLLLSLRRARVSLLLSITIVGIAGANSLSVSGLNSPFVATIIVLALLHSGPSFDSHRKAQV